MYYIQQLLDDRTVLSTQLPAVGDLLITTMITKTRTSCSIDSTNSKKL